MKLAAQLILIGYFSAILDQALGPRMVLGGIRPDFYLVGIACASLLAPNPAGIWSGFIGGLLQGMSSGANLFQYVLSRTLTGFAGSRIGGLEIEIGPVLAAVFCALLTLFGQVVLMFVAPPRAIGAFMQDTILTAVYNGVLAIPIYAALRPMMRSYRLEVD